MPTSLTRSLSRTFTFNMASSVRSLRSKLLFNRPSPNAVRSLLFLTRSSSHSVAEVSRTTTVSPERDQNAAINSEQTLRGFSFNDGNIAFRSKTSWEIIRALAIFRLCSFDFLVNRNKEVSKRYFKIFYYLRNYVTLHRLASVFSQVRNNNFIPKNI